MIQAVVLRMYAETEENRFPRGDLRQRDKEVLYFKDFNSGAMIQNIVDRAKKMAIKEFLATSRKGVGCSTCSTPASTSSGRTRPAQHHNPDDWARISGKKGERIVYIRTLVSGARVPSRAGPSTRSATPASTCNRQYL